MDDCMSVFTGGHAEQAVLYQTEANVGNLHNGDAASSHLDTSEQVGVWYIICCIYICVCGNPQPEAIGHTQIRQQPDPGPILSTVCSLLN